MPINTFFRPLAILGGAMLAASPLSAKEPAAAPPAVQYKNEVKVDVLLQTDKTVDGQPIVYPDKSPEVRVLLVEIPPGGQTGWHTHPMPGIGYIISGEISVEIKGKGTTVYKAGEALAETINTLHNGTNTGTVPVRILMTIIGQEGVPAVERPAPTTKPKS